MHQLAASLMKPTLAEVRALVREEGSSLLDHVTDDQVDAAIQRDIERPAATLNLLAGSAISWVEFDVLVDRLRQAVADGSVLDCEPATDKELRAFRRASPPAPSGNPALAHAQEVAGEQLYLARRLFTLATDIVLDAGADTNAADRALAVGAALFAVIAHHKPAVAKAVLEALPADEWDALIGARTACVDEYRRDQAVTA